jgi:hypothetical protein
MNILNKYGPVLLAFLFTYLVYHYHIYITEFETLIPSVTQSCLTIAGTLLGFLLTILTVVSTITTRRMQFIKDAGKFPELISFLHKSILANISIIVFCFFQLFIKRAAVNVSVLKFIDYIFIFLALFNIFLTARFVIIFIKLLADKSIRAKPAKKELNLSESLSTEEED